MKSLLNKCCSLLVLSILTFNVSSSWAVERLRLATTTSTENSGLLAVLNPAFEKKYNTKIDVIAVGTGKAIRLAENGDVDVILVHAPAAEKKFVDAGFGIDRQAVMHNDFVVLGPKTDPADVKASSSLNEGMNKIATTESVFISRGDDSGTNKKEKLIWNTVGIKPAGEWYLAVGQGMGAVLKIANDKLAYTLTDRGTWLAYQDKSDLMIVSEGDKTLFNPYHVIAVNPERHAHVKYKLATDYMNFITSEEGQEIIGNFKANGELLFQPDALPKEVLE